jgi:mono/diheme cytochrome c family protein
MQSTVNTLRAPHRFRNRTHLVCLISACIVMAFGAAGFAQDETKVKAGLDVWKTAGCAECHGALGDGERQRDEAPAGANLRQMRLDDAAIAETVRCGREGTGMPRFGEDAYTPRGCYGRPAGPVPDGLYPAPRQLSQPEIDAVVVYLRARVVGRRAVTPEECSYYYGEDADAFCDDPNADK